MSITTFISRKHLAPNLYGGGLLFLGGILAVMTSSLTHTLKSYPPFEVLFLKATTGLIFFVMIYGSKLHTILPTTQFFLHAIKNSIATLGNLAWILALFYLPLADCSALSLTSALFTSLGGWFIYKEKFHFSLLLAFLMGTAGVMFIVKPQHLIFNLYSLLPLCSAFCFSCSSLLIKNVAKKDSSKTTLFYLLFFLCIFTIYPAHREWIAPTFMDTMKMIGIGISYCLTQVTIIEAYTYAAASFIAPFKFIRLPLNVISGVLFFGELPSWLTLTGAALILSACLLIAITEKRRRRNEIAL